MAPLVTVKKVTVGEEGMLALGTTWVTVKKVTVGATRGVTASMSAFLANAVVRVRVSLGA